MQPKHQPVNRSILLYNWQALKVCLPYLKLSDLLASSTVSKQWQYHLKKYIKQYILPEAQSNLHADAFQAVKIMFNRKLIIRTLDHVKQVEFPEICSRVEVGNHATLLNTLEGNTYAIKTDLLNTITRNDWTDQNKAFKVPCKFTRSKCIGNYIYLIGENQILRYTTSAGHILTQEQAFDFNGIIQHFIASISAVLIVLNSQTKDSHFEYLFFTHKQPNPQRVEIAVNIENPSNDIVLTYAQHGFIISNQGTVYQADFQQKPVKLAEVKALKGKCITKIKCGSKHYFAYEPKKKLVKKWTNADVLKWAEDQGLGDFTKILQAEKVTGQKLLQMNKTYMQDVLGMTSNLTHQKITVLLQQANTITDNFQEYVVHSWGKNEKGQLCVNPSGNIGTPIKLKLPDNTEIFTCFGDHTILRNTVTEQLTINSMDDKEKLKWEPLTHNKVWALSGHKNTIVYCQSMGKKWVSQSMCEEPIHLKKQKLRTAKNIIDQIQWDTKYKPEQFSVGYLNRLQGTLECSFEDYMKSDVKENSVLYFKYNGKVVWDKKTRMDTL